MCIGERRELEFAGEGEQNKAMFFFQVASPKLKKKGDD